MRLRVSTCLDERVHEGRSIIGVSGNLEGNEEAALGSQAGLVCAVLSPAALSVRPVGRRASYVVSLYIPLDTGIPTNLGTRHNNLLKKRGLAKMPARLCKAPKG
jgi:hypothetical protein